MESDNYQVSSSPILLTGRNLGERQKDLNSKVNDAVAQKINFEDIKNLLELSDIEKIFKIDIASKYKNTEYIVDILKSGDDLYISRALRSKWLYDEEFSHIFNPHYLKEHVFPYMSYKMQRKMLTAVSMHIQNPDRAESFLNFCLETQLYHIELKFLPIMSEQSRLNFLNRIDAGVPKLKAIEKKLEHIIGNSFVLADSFIQKVDNLYKDKILYRLRYLYSYSEHQYLDLLEKYAQAIFNTGLKFGKKMSKDVALKYKNRILSHPLPYLQKLSTDTLIKHSTTDEVKLYTQTWFPDVVTKFWYEKYCKKHSQLLDAIPSEERFEFVKSIFAEKFPGEEFETCNDFYTSDSYVIMTEEQKHKWALQNIDQEKCVSRKESYYVWYKFLPFEKAFTLLKEQHAKCQNSSERSILTEILIECCKTQEDLQKLFEFYYENIVTEDANCKIEFVMKVQKFHKVYEFKGKCWEFFQEVLLDNDIMRLSKNTLKLESTASTVFLYHVIHSKEIPSELGNLIESDYYSPYKVYNLTEIQKNKVHEFLIEQHVNFMKDLDESKADSKIKAKRSVRDVINLIHTTKDKTKKDIPEIIQKYLKLYWEDFHHYPIFDIKDKDLYKALKKDVDLVKPLESIKMSLAAMNDHFRLTKFLKKLKVYFPFDDITKETLKFLHELIRTPEPDSDCRQKTILFCVASIFLLSNKTDTNYFLIAHIPANGKIRNWSDFEPSVLIQQAICAHAHLARPLPDIDFFVNYVKGDYIIDCSSTLKAFIANLPFKLAIQFLERLIKSSDEKAQNKAIKLAFLYIPDSPMYDLFMNLWRTTNGGRIRKKLYKSMSKAVMYEFGEDQIQMYKDIIRPMTLGLHKDELVRNMGILDTEMEYIPDAIKGIHLQTLWQVSSKLGNRRIMSRTLKDMAQEIAHMEKGAIDKIVHEFIQGTWQSDKAEVVAAYLIYYTSNEHISKTREIANVATTKLINLNLRGTPVEKCMIWKFLSQLTSHNYDIPREEYQTTNEILTNVLNQILNLVSFENISYISFWDMKLAVIWNRVMDLGIFMLKEKEFNRKAITKELMHCYATQVNSIIQDLTTTGHYVKVHVAEIAKNITRNLEVMNMELMHFCNSNYMNWLHFLVFLVDDFVDFGKEDTIILGLHILPNKCALSECALDYAKLLEKIDSLNNAEVKKFREAKRKRIISSDEEE